MNVILLTVLALGGTGSGGPEMQQAPQAGAYGGDCDACGGYGGRGYRGAQGGCCFLGTPPQSCYDPSFGCYTSNRHMHRYPAFHGTFYRQAYNYRNYFDYPWHAGLHEPTSYFSYHVPGEQGIETVPTPAAEPAAQMQPRPAIRTAAVGTAPAIQIQPQPAIHAAAGVSSISHDMILVEPAMLIPMRTLRR